MKSFSIVSVNISTQKGDKKTPVESISLKVGHGVEGDAHAGDWHRQISLLAQEDIDTMRAKGADVVPGDFAENITTQGIELPTLPIGSRMRIGDTELEVTQIGKKCHQGCAIMQQVGDCIMPRRGIFAKVITGGEISCESAGSYDF